MSTATQKTLSGARAKKSALLTAEQARTLAELKGEMDENHREIERLGEETRDNLAKTKAVLDSLNR